jgi:NADH-quinone oxidoreductase subunit G
MYEACPVLARPDEVTRAPWGAFGEAGPVAPSPFVYPIADFYHTDPISRASEMMRKCSALHLAGEQAMPQTGTDG